MKKFATLLALLPFLVLSPDPAQADAGSGFLDSLTHFFGTKEDPATVMSGTEAVEHLSSSDSFKEKLTLFQGLAQTGKPVKLSALSWPFPETVKTIRLTPQDIEPFEKKTGLSITGLPLAFQRFGDGSSIDPNLMIRLLDHADLRRVDDQNFELELFLKPSHCKLEEMDDITCTKDRIYIPGSKSQLFGKIVRAHEELRNPEPSSDGAPCDDEKIRKNGLLEVAPGFRSLAEPKPGPTAEKIRGLISQFKTARDWNLQSVELDPRVSLKISLEPDADGDAVVRVHGFKGIQARVQIPQSSPYVVPEARILTGILDGFTRGAMNGTLDFSPREIYASKLEQKTTISGGLGMISLGYSTLTGPEVLGLNKDSAIVRSFAGRFAVPSR